VLFKLPFEASASKTSSLPKQTLFLLENDFVSIGLSNEIWAVFFFFFKPFCDTIQENQQDLAETTRT